MNNSLNKKLVSILAPASQTNSATRTINLDTLGADYATIMINLASALNTNAVGGDIKLLESDDTTASNFATWNSNFVRTSEVITAAKQVIFQVDTRTRKRYIQLSITTHTATNDNLTASAVAILGRMGVNPPAASSNLGSTNDVVVVG